MIYKTSWKEYLIRGVIVGGILCIICSIWRGVIFGGIVMLSGVLSFFVVMMFCSKLEKRVESIRVEISKLRNIVCEGPANLKNGINSVGGWLFLSEDALEFYPHKMNIGGDDTAILLDDIVNVETKVNQIIIQTKNKTFKFVVSRSNLWKKSITQIL